MVFFIDSFTYMWERVRITTHSLDPSRPWKNKKSNSASPPAELESYLREINSTSTGANKWRWASPKHCAIVVPKATSVPAEPFECL